MPLDHYVSQVHLRNFYSPALGNMMFAMRKTDLKAFTCRSQDVCRIPDGSTTNYLADPRAVEKFLEVIEPKYNASVEKLREGRPDPEVITSIAGFAAYVAACSPTARRINIAPLENILLETAATLDSQGLFDRAPDSLGNKALTELLMDGTVKFDIDPKYPQAISVSNLLETTTLFGSGRWEVLINNSDSPYLTSDFPAAIEAKERGIMRRIVPLTPELAVRISPDLSMRGKVDLSFPNFKVRYRKAGHQEVSAINRTIVRCAEEMVFYCDEQSWIPDFIWKNRKYQVEVLVDQAPHGKGMIRIATQRIVLRPEG
jgi:hypothetical protein